MRKFLKFLLRLLIISLLVSAISTIFPKDKTLANHASSISTAFGESAPTIEEEIEIYPSFSNLLSLRDFLNAQKSIGNSEATFIYNGAEDILKDGTLAKMTSSMSTHFSYLDNKYTLTMRKYPGEKIVEAYLSGDTTKLSSDELQALEVAKEIVTFGLEQATDPWELEQFLHDVIAETVSIYSL